MSLDLEVSQFAYRYVLAFADGSHARAPRPHCDSRAPGELWPSFEIAFAWRSQPTSIRQLNKSPSRDSIHADPREVYEVLCRRKHVLANEARHVKTC